MNYLDKRCEYSECNAILQASRSKSKAEREKRDAEKRFCGAGCANKHRAQRIGNIADQFLYGKVS